MIIKKWADNGLVIWYKSGDNINNYTTDSTSSTESRDHYWPISLTILVSQHNLIEISRDGFYLKNPCSYSVDVKHNQSLTQCPFKVILWSSKLVWPTARPLIIRAFSFGMERKMWCCRCTMWWTFDPMTFQGHPMTISVQNLSNLMLGP